MFEIVNAVGDFVREMETVCNRMLEAPIIKHSMAVENCMFIAYITDTLLKRFWTDLRFTALDAVSNTIIVLGNDEWVDYLKRLQ